MSTFREANQVRLILKMKLHYYAWYKSSVVVSNKEEYSVVIGAKHLDNKIRKLISPVMNGVSVKVEVES
jgi:hypothetical protein